MAKPKSPLLSLGARGTIGDALTFQKRGREHIARTKPIPTDPYSLNQAYQRWDYRDYAYLWTLLTNSEKQVYRTKASRYHITGFSQWMRENLKDLTDMRIRLHLDELGGAIAQDSSKQGNNAIITGATPVDGLISGAYSFDGLNDRIVLPVSSTLQNFTQRSITFFFKTTPFTGGTRVIFDNGYYAAPWGDLLILLAGSNNLWAGFKNTLAVSTAFIIPFTPDSWQHFAYTWDGTNIIAYIDATPIAPVAFSGILACSPYSPTLGAKAVPGLWLDGIIDEFKIDHRVLDQTEITRMSERRYPA